MRFSASGDGLSTRAARLYQIRLSVTVGFRVPYPLSPLAGGEGTERLPPRYTPTTCFETFPFPAGLTPNLPVADYADDPRAQAIAAAARKLNALRENWLNPPQWMDRVPEVVPGLQICARSSPDHHLLFRVGNRRARLLLGNRDGDSQRPQPPDEHQQHQ